MSGKIRFSNKLLFENIKVRKLLYENFFVMKIPWAYKSQLRDSLTASLSNLSVLFEQEGKYTLGSVSCSKNEHQSLHSCNGDSIYRLYSWRRFIYSWGRWTPKGKKTKSRKTAAGRWYATFYVCYTISWNSSYFRRVSRLKSDLLSHHSSTNSGGLQFS